MPIPPPGLTCAACERPFAGWPARRTTAGWVHAQSCGAWVGRGLVTVWVGPPTTLDIAAAGGPPRRLTVRRPRRVAA